MLLTHADFAQTMTVSDEDTQRRVWNAFEQRLTSTMRALEEKSRLGDPSTRVPTDVKMTLEECESKLAAISTSAESEKRIASEENILEEIQKHSAMKKELEKIEIILNSDFGGAKVVPEQCERIGDILSRVEDCR